MVPPKAPDGKGRSATTATGDRSKTSPLSIREFHGIVLRVLSLAAFTEGPTVKVGGRAERKLHDSFRKISKIVEQAESAVPLADVMDTRGKVVSSFRLSHFKVVQASYNLLDVCKKQKKLIGTQHFSPDEFAGHILDAFAYAHIQIDRATALDAANRIVERERFRSPSAMAGVILQVAGLPGMRDIQYQRRVLEEARVARASLHRNDFEAERLLVAEFLVCLQVDRSEVLGDALRLIGKIERRNSGSDDYSLRDTSFGKGRKADPERRRSGAPWRPPA